MDDKEKVEFFKEWLDEIDGHIKKIELSIINSSSYRRLWKLEQKCKLYNSSKQLRDFFSELVYEIDTEMEELLGDVDCMNKDLYIYSLLKSKIEEEMARYQQS